MYMVYLMEFFLHICLSYYGVSYKMGLTLKFVVLFWTEQFFSFQYGPFQVRHMYDHLVFLQFENQIIIKKCNSKYNLIFSVIKIIQN